jgi:hypothetical protein
MGAKDPIILQKYACGVNLYATCRPTFMALDQQHRRDDS